MIKATVHHIFTDLCWESEWHNRDVADLILFEDTDPVVFISTDQVEVAVPKHIMDDCVVYFEEV